MAFPVEEKFIELAEAELSVKFPESFRNKMMKLNGGSVQIPGDDEVDEDELDYYELNQFYDSSDKKRIKRTCNSIVHETKMHRSRISLRPIRVYIQSLEIFAGYFATIPTTSNTGAELRR